MIKFFETSTGHEFIYLSVYDTEKETSVGSIIYVTGGNGTWGFEPHKGFEDYFRNPVVRRKVRVMNNEIDGYHGCDRTIDKIISTVRHGLETGDYKDHSFLYGSIGVPFGRLNSPYHEIEIRWCRQTHNGKRRWVIEGLWFADKVRERFKGLIPEELLEYYFVP